MKILVYGGWYGSGNLGDEAILQGVDRVIKRRLPEAELTALSIDPERTINQTGVHAERIESPRTLIRNRDHYLSLFKDADLHLLTGGTPFYDYGHLSRLIHMGLPALNHQKVACFGVGSKPITTMMGREITRMLLRNASIISTRDTVSKQILQPLAGELVKPINVTGDSALILDPVETNRGKLVLFCPRRLIENHKVLYHQKLDKATINRIRHMQARAADQLIADGYRVVFMPFHTFPPDDDVEEIRVIRNLMHSEFETFPRPENTVEALRIIGGATILVGLRLHSLIFASMQGTPFTSVDYDIKIKGHMEHIGAAEYLSKTTQGLNQLYMKTVKALDDQQYSNRLKKRVTTIRGLINAEADRLMDTFTPRNTRRSSS